VQVSIPFEFPRAGPPAVGAERERIARILKNEERVEQPQKEKLKA